MIVLNYLHHSRSCDSYKKTAVIEYRVQHRYTACRRCDNRPCIRSDRIRSCYDTTRSYRTSLEMCDTRPHLQVIIAYIFNCRRREASLFACEKSVITPTHRYIRRVCFWRSQASTRTYSCTCRETCRKKFANRNDRRLQNDLIKCVIGSANKMREFERPVLGASRSPHTFWQL